MKVEKCDAVKLAFTLFEVLKAFWLLPKASSELPLLFSKVTLNPLSKIKRFKFHQCTIGLSGNPISSTLIRRLFKVANSSGKLLEEKL